MSVLAFACGSRNAEVGEIGEIGEDGGVKAEVIKRETRSNTTCTISKSNGMNTYMNQGKHIAALVACFITRSL